MEKSLKELIKIIKKTREKCPWTKRQTLEKQKKEIMGEVEEVAKAIERKDYTNLKEELGDLLHDTLLLIEICADKNLFTRKEVIQEIIQKMKRRKPWVFGDIKVKNREEAIKIWEEIKKKEKKDKQKLK